jgi:hypothetical protein
MDIFSPTIKDDVTITGSSNANLLRVSSPSNTNILFVSGSGNVGIGTGTPGFKLDVNGSFRNNGFWTDGSGVSNWGVGSSQTSYGVLTWDTGFASIYATSGNRLRLGANGTQGQLVISSSGRVGVGTETPQRLFDVYNGGVSGIAASFGAQFSNNSFSGISFGYVEQANTSYRKSALVFERTETHGGGTNASGKIHFLLNNNSSTSATALTDAVVTIDSVGTTVGSARMGIGTRFPTASLHISGTVATDNLMRVQSTTGAEYFFISASGNVGIGTTSPSAKLHVIDGDILIENNRSFLSKNTGGSSLALLKFDTSNNAQIGSVFQGGSTILYATSDFIFYNYPSSTVTERMRITSTGNVGIGTSNPTEKLYVDGNVIVTGRITAEEFHTEFVSASIIYQSGSTQFGNSLDDTHTFTGSINTTGSLSLKGPLYDNLGTAGTADQILFTTSTGVEWRDNFAENVIITGKNVGVSTIQKGTPLYFTSSGTSGNIVGILPDTSAFNSGDNVYIAVGGGYTNIKPTGSAFIQKIGNVEKVNASNGSTVIQGPNWFNDLPNWEIGRVMVGRSNGQPVTSSLVYLDESNSRLGLGTTTPLSTLTVAGGNVNINSGFAIGGNNLGSFSPFIRYSNTGAGVPSSSFGHTSAYMLSDAGGVFGTNDLSFYAGAITQPEIMRIVGSTGFVGIGESSPSAKLEIKGSGATSATTALRVENSNASASLTILNDGTSAFNTSHLYVSSSGNVGIGTTTPTAKLQISTVSNGSSSLDAAGSSFNGVHAILPGRIYVGASATAYPQIMYNAIPSQSAAWRYAGNDTAWAIDMGGNNQMRFRYAGAGTTGNNITWTDIMVLASGSGNVGIGTSSPTNRLEVAGGVTATSFTGSLFGTSSWAQNAQTASFLPTGTYNITSSWATNALTASFLNGAFLQNGNSFGATALLGTNDNQNLQFETNGTVRMHISSSGNVGIGLTNPSARLYVSGAAVDGLLHVGSPTLANTLFVTGSGRVGIGTNTPSQLFEIVRSSNTKIVAGDNVGIQTGTASEWIHLSSDPASSKYIRIDATQFSASPTEQNGTPDTAIGQSGNTSKYLTEPDYWIEIKLGAAGGDIVLIPCYIKGV